MKPFLFFALLLVTLFNTGLTSRIHAQTDDTVAVIVQNDPFGGDANIRLITITSAGVSETPLSTGLTGLQLTDAAISPDFRYLAVTYRNLSSDTSAPITLYELGTGQVRTVENPAEMRTGSMDIGGFSPDGSRFAVSYVGVDYSNTEAPFVGGAFTVDAATGEIDSLVPIDILNPVLPFQGIWLLMGEWKADGVRIHPNCYGCEGAYEGEYSIWNPDTNEIIPQSGEFFSDFFGTVLDGTGEMVYLARDERFPGDPFADMFPTPNVALYFPDGRLPRFDQRVGASVAYFEPDDIRLDGRVHWVDDGRGFLIVPHETDGDNAHYVNRNGGSGYYTLIDGYTFFGGTRDGWLWAEPAENADRSLPLAQLPRQIVHLDPDEFGVLRPTPLGTISGFTTAMVIHSPELGFVEGLAPFPDIQPPSPESYAAILASNMPQCPGLMPSRLFIGGTARVTPGDPNRLRDQPSRDGAILGEIPGGAPFIVLDGPICAENIAWWQVNYNGTIGYTAEFQGSTYFVEPVVP